MCASRPEAGHPRVVIVPAEASDVKRARAISRQSGLAIAGDDWRAAADFALRIAGERLSLVDRESKDSAGIEAVLPSSGANAGRVSRREPLGRAFGPRVRTIVDATAGLGHDSLLLARIGFDVMAVERSPVLAVMLRHALQSFESMEPTGGAIADRLRIFEGDAREILPAIEPKPDAVYVDPMFPPRRKKSALAKKSIRMVRALVGDDPDAAELLAAALASATERVVVKRLDDAPPLAPGAIAQIKGRTVRYDVYRAGLSHEGR